MGVAMAEKSPSPERIRRHGGDRRLRAADVQALVGGEEERPAARDRSARAQAVVRVVALIRRDGLVEVVGVGVEAGAVEVEERRAVELVRAGPRDGRDVAQLRELRGVVHRAHLDFLDRLDRREDVDALGADAIPPHARREDAVDRHLGLVGQRARERELLAHALHLWNRLNRGNRRRILRAKGERQLLQLAVADLAGYGRRLGIDERSAAADGDLLRETAHRQPRIDAHRLPRLDAEGLGRELLKARQARRRRGRGPASDSETRRLPIASVTSTRASVVCTSVSVTVAPGRDPAARVGRVADDGTVGRLGRRARRHAHEREDHRAGQQQAIGHSTPPHESCGDGTRLL